MTTNTYSLLQTIDDPSDLRRLSRAELKTLAQQLRAYVLDSVSKTGGHLSSNLGTVELTVALHAVFDTPYDRVVWDVGHQTYPHKILTGRRERMASLRQFGGLSGFPQRAEEPVRHLRHGALLHQHLGRPGHGPGRQAKGRGPPRHRRHRRRRHDGRHGLRGG